MSNGPVLINLWDVAGFLGCLSVLVILGMLGGLFTFPIVVLIVFLFFAARFFAKRG